MTKNRNSYYCVHKLHYPHLCDACLEVVWAWGFFVWPLGSNSWCFHPYWFQWSLSEQPLNIYISLKVIGKSSMMIEKNAPRHYNTFMSFIITLKFFRLISWKDENGNRLLERYKSLFCFSLLVQQGREWEEDSKCGRRCVLTSNKQYIA